MPLLKHILEQRAAERAAASRKVASGFEHAGQAALAQVIDQSVAKHLGPVRRFLADSQNSTNQLSAKNLNVLSKAIATAELGVKKDVEDAFSALIAQISSVEERFVTLVQSIPPPKETKIPKIDLDPLTRQLRDVLDAVKAIPLGYEIDIPPIPPYPKMPTVANVIRDRNGFIDRIEFS